MPAYTVTAPVGQLSSIQKQRLAMEITRVHCDVTGAPSYFVQVIFNDVPGGNYFRGGRVLEGSRNVYVHGRIRAGRDSGTKERLLLELMGAVAVATEIDSTNVQVYLVEVPAQQIVEFGRILPLPGEEEAWWQAMPASVRARIEAMGD